MVLTPTLLRSPWSGNVSHLLKQPFNEVIAHFLFSSNLISNLPNQIFRGTVFKWKKLLRFKLKLPGFRIILEVVVLHSLGESEGDGIGNGKFTNDTSEFKDIQVVAREKLGSGSCFGSISFHSLF